MLPRSCQVSGWLGNALLLDGSELAQGFALAARNIPNVDVLPQLQINVYDIMRRDALVLTKAAVETLEQSRRGDDDKSQEAGQTEARSGKGVFDSQETAYYGDTMASQFRQYGFVVDMNATKPQVKDFSKLGM